MNDVRDPYSIRTERNDAHEESRGERFVKLRQLDAQNNTTTKAAAYLGPSGYLTYSPPHRFAGLDGIPYMVKTRAQGGKGAELIAGRLGSYLGIAPRTTVLEVGAAALPSDHSIDHLRGLHIATELLDSVMNSSELRAVDIRLAPNQIDWASWAQVVCYQTWLFVGDPQAVIRMTDGKVFSIDHGKCFEQLLKGPPTSITVPDLPGASGVAFPDVHIVEAVEKIEAVPADAILAMVAGVPDEPGWRLGIEARLRVAEWLIKRQPRLREVMDEWIPRFS